jgi:hypothetical protein
MLFGRQLKKYYRGEREMKKKRYSFEMTTCSSCKYWKDKENFFGYCPVLKKETEADESCNDHEDMDK